MTFPPRNRVVCRRTAPRTSPWSPLTAWLAVMALLASMSAPAGLRIIEPGAPLELAADEGLIALALDSHADGFGLRIKRSGALMSEFIDDRRSGVSVTLLAAPAGDYQFVEVKQPNGTFFSLSGRPELSFRVEAGLINYPGDLQIHVDDLWDRVRIFENTLSLTYARVRMVNRGLRARSALQRAFPELLDRHALRFSGAMPDPFLQNLDGSVVVPAYQARAADAGAPLQTVRHPIFTHELFRRGGTEAVRLSPDGRWLVRYESNVPVGDKLEDQLHLLDAQTGEFKTVLWKIFAEAFASVELDWAGPDTVLISGLQANGRRHVVIVGPVTDVIENRSLTGAHVVDGLPEIPGSFIVARPGGAFGKLELYRVPLEGFAWQSDLKPAWKIRRRLKDDWDWLFDAAGRMRVALRTVDDRHALMASRDGATWRRVIDFPASESVSLGGFGATDETVYLLTNHDRDQIDLVRVDLETGALETRLSVPGVDLDHVIRVGRQVVGARLRSAGALRSIYLSSVDDRPDVETRRGRLPAHYRLHQVDVAGDVRHYVAESAEGVTLALLQTPSGWHEVGVERPFLRELPFGSTRVLQATSADGLAIQGFLTVPAGQGPFPVLVIPHGGPMAVSDTADFDGHVQFWVLRGFAVVRANYRGSGGFGKAFLSAAKGQWGRLIEADIAAVLAVALQDDRLDASRIGLWGASYGGYSALVTAFQQPERFRCVVSLSGITDLPLLFSSSDWSVDPAAVDRMREWVGDPDTALEDLLAYSPLFQVGNFTGRALLIHGRQDRRVSVEHADRLVLAARLQGKDVVSHILRDEGHTISKLSTWVDIQDRSLDFFDRCLNLEAVIRND